MKPFQKIFANKLEREINTFLKNNVKQQGRFFSTKTESYVKGIGIDNHELNLKTSLVIKEEKNDIPTCVNGVGIDNYEPTPKTLLSKHSICVNGVGVDNYEPNLQPSFFAKQEKNDIPTYVNGIGMDNYEPTFSK